ncbi:MAG TPA: hypothetical protein DEV81_00530 [Cyanobacteria bacterium UBA11049]|nr:hypothetical protein [Cyanobacteria bacterium UBA11049]
MAIANLVGYVAKNWQDRQLDLLDLDRLEAIADILSWIDPHVKSDEPAIIEALPHPAIVNLFNLERILKYKKGKLAERHLERTKLHQFIVNILATLEPPLNLKEQGKRTKAQAIHFILQPTPTGKQATSFILQGAALKAVKDRLDSPICTYVAANWWYWGLERNWVLGDRTTGYIVVPTNLPI